jgi:Virulence factor BrkB
LALGARLALFGIVAFALVAVLPTALALLPVSGSGPWSHMLSLLRWPILAGIVTLALAIVYRYALDRAEPKWQWISCGSVAATIQWISGSIAFTIFVSKVGSYDRTYGSLGAVIILLLWFYLTAYVILARRGGAERGDRASNPSRPSGIRTGAIDRTTTAVIAALVPRREQRHCRQTCSRPVMIPGWLLLLAGPVRLNSRSAVVSRHRRPIDDMGRQVPRVAAGASPMRRQAIPARLTRSQT